MTATILTVLSDGAPGDVDATKQTTSGYHLFPVPVCTVFFTSMGAPRLTLIGAFHIRINLQAVHHLTASHT